MHNISNVMHAEARKNAVSTFFRQPFPVIFSDFSVAIALSGFFPADTFIIYSIGNRQKKYDRRKKEVFAGVCFYTPVFFIIPPLRLGFTLCTASVVVLLSFLFPQCRDRAAGEFVATIVQRVIRMPFHFMKSHFVHGGKP